MASRSSMTRGSFLLCALLVFVNDEVDFRPLSPFVPLHVYRSVVQELVEEYRSCEQPDYVDYGGATAQGEREPPRG
jgi:hypothetical protein